MAVHNEGINQLVNQAYGGWLDAKVSRRVAVPVQAKCLDADRVDTMRGLGFIEQVVARIVAYKCQTEPDQLEELINIEKIDDVDFLIEDQDKTDHEQEEENLNLQSVERSASKARETDNTTRVNFSKSKIMNSSDTGYLGLGSQPTIMKMPAISDKVATANAGPYVDRSGSGS